MKQETYTLEQVCDMLGVRLSSPPNLRDLLGIQPHIVAHFPQLGGKNGLLLVCDYDELAPHVRKLTDAGFAFSTIEWQDTQQPVTVSNAIRLFSDWGWASNDHPRPEWLVESDE